MKDNPTKQSMAQFNEWADHYDQGMWNLYFEASNKKAANLLNFKDEAQILDLGCGTGKLAVRLAKMKSTKNVVGLDISSEMIKIATHKRFSEGVPTEKLKFVLGEVESLPFPDNSFDYIFCLNSFHHYEDQNKALIEIRRVLKNRGSFILLDPFLDNPIRLAWGTILKVIFKEPYAKYHTRKSLRKMLSQSGLKVYQQRAFACMTLFTVAEK